MFICAGLWFHIVFEMPELPEVETVVRGLRPALPGRSITGLRFGKTDFIRDSVMHLESLPGSRFLEVRRLGKFIHLVLEPSMGAGNHVHLFIHLGMTGQLVAQPAALPAAKHTHVVFQLDDGCELRYTDARRFGRILLVPHSMLESFCNRLGADPLEVSEVDFRRQLAARRGMIKALLLDQKFLRGLGNIYTDESLWRARIHPKRNATRLRTSDVRRLYRAVQKVLSEAISMRGSSVSDYVDSAGEPGEYQLRHRVYGRKGKPCFRCRTKIRRILVAGRSSHFCPRCQRA